MPNIQINANPFQRIPMFNQTPKYDPKAPFQWQQEETRNQTNFMSTEDLSQLTPMNNGLSFPKHF